MPDVMPHEIANSIMGKLYDVLTNGDETVPKSEDNFFSWCTPGIPMDPSDFEFLQQGLTGVVKKKDVDTMRKPSVLTARLPLEVRPLVPQLPALPQLSSISFAP